MQLTKNKKGFTLLEIIIVIIIIGVLASLALPRFFRTVEYSKGSEGLTALSAIRQSVERCFAQRGSYVDCDDFGNLDIPDPTAAAGTHFAYSFPDLETATAYTVRATRNATDGGNGVDYIQVITDNTAGTVTKSGTGAFSGVQ